MSYTYGNRPPPPMPPLGPLMFGTLALLVLGLSGLIVPSLTSTSINGERTGTLAVLQSTLLRPRSIVVAKFAAAMIMAGAFLVLTLPIALWAYVEGGIQLGRSLVVVYLILFLMMGLFAAVGLAASSMVRRPSLSAVAAYGVVFLLTAGLPMLFGLALLGAPEQRTSDFGGEREIGWRWGPCAPDPFVVLADAAPRNEQKGRARNPGPGSARGHPLGRPQPASGAAPDPVQPAGPGFRRHNR